MTFSELDLPQFAAHGQGGSGPSKAGADQAIDTGMQIDMAVEQTNRWGGKVTGTSLLIWCMKIVQIYC